MSGADGFPTPEQFAARNRSDTARASRQTAQAVEKTRDLTALLLTAQEQLVAAQRQMLEAQTTADVREVKMLFWTRVAGVLHVELTRDRDLVTVEPHPETGRLRHRHCSTGNLQGAR
jgi:hypothetical protein